MTSLSAFGLGVELNCQCKGCNCDSANGNTKCGCCASSLKNFSSRGEGSAAFFASSKAIHLYQNRHPDNRSESSSVKSGFLLAVFIPTWIVSSLENNEESIVSDVLTDEDAETRKFRKWFRRKKHHSKDKKRVANEGLEKKSTKLNGEHHQEEEFCRSRPQHLCDSCKWTDCGNRTGRRTLSSLLVKIHPSLSNFVVRGIILTHQSCSKPTCAGPADLVLFDLPDRDGECQSHRLLEFAKIMDEVNGESMVAAPEAVIKAFLVSNITYSNTTLRQSFDLSNLEIPPCPVCLHRIDPLRLGLPAPKSHHLCSHICAIPFPSDAQTTCCNNKFLSPWPLPSHCSVCTIIEEHKKSLSVASSTQNSPPLGSEEARCSSITSPSPIHCYECNMRETLWVCLTCGLIGCGRYSGGHLDKHYRESGHPYCLELATKRIWDYAADEFVQRMDIFKCPSFKRTLSWPRRSVESEEDDELLGGEEQQTEKVAPIQQEQEVTESSYFPAEFQHCTHEMDETSPKKATMIGEEYEALLQSALEDQAQHYDMEISRLRAELTAEHVKGKEISEKDTMEIRALQAGTSNLRSEAEHLGRKLLEAQAQEAGFRATSQRLLREQQQSKELLDKLREEAKREHKEGKLQVEDLEQQISDLTANLKMRQQISQNLELSNAQIFGTTSSRPQKKGGKKARKFRR